MAPVDTSDTSLPREATCVSRRLMTVGTCVVCTTRGASATGRDVSGGGSTEATAVPGTLRTVPARTERGSVMPLACCSSATVTP